MDRCLAPTSCPARRATERVIAGGFGSHTQDHLTGKRIVPRIKVGDRRCQLVHMAPDARPLPCHTSERRPESTPPMIGQAFLPEVHA